MGLNIRARSSSDLSLRRGSVQDRRSRLIALRALLLTAGLNDTPTSRQPRPERIAEEVELLVGIVSAPVIIFAIDDLRLLGMKHQPTFGEPLRKRLTQASCLRFAPAVADWVSRPEEYHP